MDPVWLLLLLPTAAVGGWVMAKRERATPRNTAGTLPKAYFKGLSFLLNERPDKALQVFIEMVEVDGETIELHLALGNLFRRNGELERATRIHQNLAARADLDAGLRALALLELAQDYFKAGLFDRAESLFQELRRAEPHREQANQFLLQIYDQEKEWRCAIAAAEELMRISACDLSARVAQYYCELAENSIIAGRNARAEKYVDAALRRDPHCIRAVIARGRLAALRGDHHDAIAIWRGLERWAPQSVGEVLNHLANSYAAVGDSHGYKQFLEKVLQYNLDARIIMALAELSPREPRGGRDMLLDLVRKYASLEGLYALVKSRAGRGRSAREDKDFAMIAELLARAVAQVRGYRCGACGFNSHALHWQCPGCKGWGTVQKQIPPRADSTEVAAELNSDGANPRAGE